MDNNLEPANERTVVRKSNTWGNAGILISTFAVIVLIVAAYFSYLQFAKLNAALVNSMNDQQKKYTQLQNDFNQMSTKVENLSAAFTKQSQVNDVQQQNWQVVHANHLVKLANDYLTIFHDQRTVLSLLQAAQNQLQNNNDSRLDGIKQALTTDISNLKSANADSDNVVNTYNKLSELNEKLNQLPLPNVIAQQQGSVTTNAVDEALPWWKKGLNQSWSALKQIVVIRNLQSDQLISPQQKELLLQNLHIRFGIAQSALVSQQVTIYQNTLNDLIQAIKNNFIQDAPATQEMLQNLEALKNVSSTASKMSISASVQAFDQYMQSQQQ